MQVNLKKELMDMALIDEMNDDYTVLTYNVIYN